MTLAQRIKNLRKELGLNQTEFATRIGITQTSLSQLEGEKNGISYDVFKAIVSEFNVNPVWLMDGVGTMYSSENAASISRGAIPLVVQVDKDDEENIVMVDRKAAAGYLQHQQDPDFISKLPSFRLPGFYGKSFRAFEITGDSMLPGINPGDMIVGSYVESLNEIRNGSVYIVVTHDGSIVAKRVTALGNDIYELKSDNAVYEPYAVKAEDIAQIWKAESRITKKFEAPAGNERLSSLEQRLIELERKLK
ncbi:MAG: helix-turn-helix domain-containing protein [Bacteroidia bacterium]|nr:helix-turn-helix domain-containing protein [Bacteroidia bacterium]